VRTAHIGKGQSKTPHFENQFILRENAYSLKSPTFQKTSSKERLVENQKQITQLGKK
jgi:hypothetical protein